MTSLPASIESYLLEAGFSGTEILILKHLLVQDGLTMRELAIKTGKGTGVVDQATRKLLQKGIIAREGINNTLKFTLSSLDSISEWMTQDMQKKHAELNRRHQNFETFITSLERDKKRPIIQYYDGEEGIKQAYTKLLTHGKEQLQYVPVLTSAEDDPLRDFRVDYFRERRRRGIFARVIANDTQLGRRYQSRDPFEYRQTLLIPEDELQLSFEKIIVGDIMTCFNHLEKRACSIQYPELATTEKTMFEVVWKKYTDTKKATVDNKGVAPPSNECSIPLRTKTLSRLREFFLSKESLISLGIFAVFAGIATFGLYQYTSALNLQRIKDKVVSIAATGATQFVPDDLNALRTEEDWKKPEWTKVVRKLEEIRTNNSNLMYAYIIRKTSNDTIEFVADSHSLDPYANTDDDPNNDVNSDGSGKVEGTSADLLQWPGQKYDTAPPEAFDAYGGNIASEIYEDQWGRVVTGYAPIRNGTGQTVAVLAIDMEATELHKLNAQTFVPFLYFFLIFALFIFVRLAAFNRSLFREIWNVFQLKKLILILALSAEIAFFVTFGLYFYTLKLIKNEIGVQLSSLAISAATQFSTSDLDKLHLPRDMKTTEYQKVFAALNDIRASNKDITYVYILRPIELPYLWEFVADADSNYYLPFLNDANFDGILNEADEAVAPGVRYHVTSNDEDLMNSLKQPLISGKIITDQWGSFISGYTPIKDSDGRSIAVLEIDMDISKIYERVNNRFKIFIWFFGSFFLILGIKYLFTIKVTANSKKRHV